MSTKIKPGKCSSVGRESNQHSADAGLIHWCGKGFSFQSQLSVQTLLWCSYIPMYDYINICAHPVVNVRVQWTTETLKCRKKKDQVFTVGWVVRLCCNWLSLRKVI